MKILGVVGSPRLNGNTEVLVATSLAAAQEEGADIELVTLSGKSISPCDSCYSCEQTGKCRVNDDMQPIYAKLLQADGIVFGTPVYFWNVSAQAKALIDRTFAFRWKRNLRNKIVGVVLAQEAAGGGATNALSTFNNFFTIQKMIMVGRAIGLGSKKGEVKNHKSGMADAQTLGKIIVNYLRFHEIPFVDEGLTSDPSGKTDK